MKKLLSTLAILAMFVAPAFAQNMSGGYVNLISPTTVNPGDTGVMFTFYVYNGSPDTEWTKNVIFTFPTCFTVTAGSYNDGGLGWVFNFVAAGNVGSFLDGDGGWGEIYDGDGGYFYVTVDVGGGCPAGPAQVAWQQDGDVWGSPPHFITGVCDFTIGGTAVEPSTFSSVKALY
ncbi:hypothetical protein FJ251_12255 [bacterium]|nr:hypothetical protein [bacterium]